MKWLEKAAGRGDSRARVLESYDRPLLFYRNTHTQLPVDAFLNSAIAVLHQIQECLQQSVGIGQYDRQLLGETPSDGSIDLPPIGLHDDPKAVQDFLQRDLVKRLIDAGTQFQLSDLFETLDQIDEPMKVLILVERVPVLEVRAQQRQSTAHVSDF